MAAGAALSAAALLGWAQLDLPQAPKMLPLSTSPQQQAEALLASEAPSAADLAQARRATLLEIARSPWLNDAWLRLAELELRQYGYITPTAERALRRSFANAPIDPGFWRQRDRMALEHWGELPADLRQSVHDELRVIGHATVLNDAIALVGSVQNPAGRFAGALAYRSACPDCAHWETGKGVVAADLAARP